jgi:hypothetical protein
MRLHRRVFPALRDLCEEHGARFQPIDLRWGVSEDAGRDQRTVDICLAEIDRCRRITPRPNFVLLLGDRYGWRPLPTRIPADLFEQICQAATPSDTSLLQSWYRLDMNATPAETVLRPRDIDDAAWRSIEDLLRTSILSGIEELGLGARVSPSASALFRTAGAGGDQEGHSELAQAHRAALSADDGWTVAGRPQHAH